MPTLFSICAQQRRRGGAFDPLSLSPALWLDASDANTLYDATTGGSLVAADGAVARWEDKSGNARHATQATLDSRPLRKTAIQNGRDVTRFDGDNDQLAHGFTSIVSSCTIFAVVKKISEQTGYRGIVAVGPNDATGSMLLNNVTVTNKWGTFTGANRPANTNAGITNFRLLCMVDNETSGGLFYLDGIADGTWSGDTQGQSVAHIGGIGAQSSNIDIAEILVYLTALSDTDRQAVESYLAAKWGITLA